MAGFLLRIGITRMGKGISRVVNRGKSEWSILSWRILLDSRTNNFPPWGLESWSRNTLPAIMTNERERFYFFLFFFSPEERFDGYYFSMVYFSSPINSFYRPRIFPFRGYNVKLEDHFVNYRRDCPTSRAIYFYLAFNLLFVFILIRL